MKFDIETAGPSQAANGIKKDKGSKLPDTTGIVGAAGGSKMINGKSKLKTGIQEDSTASKAYKSLFTTSDKARNQPKAHWVTYNPCFY